MNLPNKISMFRILLVPILVIVYYLYIELENDLFAYFLAPIFIIASLTDFLDGYIARSRNLVTVFGKFLDPLADKLIVMAALIILNALGFVPIWITILILSREFIVTGIRLVAVGEGKVIAASNLGKYKTAATMVALVIMLFFPLHDLFAEVGLYVLYFGVLLTVVSGYDYVKSNLEIITKSM